MERLTEQGKIFDKTILFEPSEYAYYTKKKSKVIDVRKIINKLGQFEDFMEANGFENLKHLDFTLEEQNKIIDAYQQENQALKDKWEELKSILEKDIEHNQKEYDESFISAFLNYSATENWVLDRMEELEKENKKWRIKT